MKILFTFLIGLSLLLSSHHLLAEGMGGCEIPPAIDRLLDCFAEEQKQSHNLVLVAKNVEEGYCCDECPQELGVIDGSEDFGCDFVEKPWCIEGIEDFSGMEFDVPSGIEQIGLMFDYFGEVDITAARTLITSVVNSLIDKINKDKKVAPYFLCYPLTINQINVRIRIRRNECGFYYPPLGNVAYISAIDGMIYYGTLNSYTYEIDNLRTEPFPPPRPPVVVPPPPPQSTSTSPKPPTKPIPRRPVPHVPARRPYNAPRSSGHGAGY